MKTLKQTITLQKAWTVIMKATTTHSILDMATVEDTMILGMARMAMTEAIIMVLGMASITMA